MLIVIVIASVFDVPKLMAAEVVTRLNIVPSLTLELYRQNSLITELEPCVSFVVHDAANDMLGAESVAVV